MADVLSLEARARQWYEVHEYDRGSFIDPRLVRDLLVLIETQKAEIAQKDQELARPSPSVPPLDDQKDTAAAEGRIDRSGEESHS